MVEFHFFTEPYLLSSYKPGNGTYEGLGFGVIDPKGDPGYYHSTNSPISNKEDFCVSSIHFAAGSVNPTAYAITEGKVFYIDVPGSNNLLVDIILKPSLQPVNSPRIKYFIYRSVLKSSVVHTQAVTLNGTDYEVNDLLSVDSVDVNNPLTNNVDVVVNANKAHLENGTVDDPTALPTGGDVLGLKLYGSGKPITNDSFIDDIFYHDHSTHNFTGFDVGAGDSLGKFPHLTQFTTGNSDNDRCLSHFGLEILLDNELFEPKISDVLIPYAPDINQGWRQAKTKAHIINVGINSSDQAPFERENAGEHVLNYMDPAAFYGNFAESADNLNFKDIANHGDTVPSDYSETHATSQIIYNRLLKGTNNTTASGEFIFRSCNRIYIELRDERGLSHNYFHHFGSENAGNHNHLNDLRLKWSTSSSSNDIRNVSSKNNDVFSKSYFPILIIDESSNHFDDIIKYDNANQAEPITLDIEFLKSTHFIANYSAFVHTGTFNRNKANIVLDEKGAVVKALEGDSSRFTSLESEDSEPYTSPLQLKILHYLENAKSFPIAQHIKITVIKNFTVIPEDVPSVQSDNTASKTGSDNLAKLRDYEYLDHLWCPFDMRLQYPIDSDRDLIIRSYMEGNYLNNTQADGNDYMVNKGLAVEYNSSTLAAQYYTLFAVSMESRFDRFKNVYDPRNESGRVKKFENTTLPVNLPYIGSSDSKGESGFLENLMKTVVKVPYVLNSVKPTPIPAHVDPLEAGKLETLVLDNRSFDEDTSFVPPLGGQRRFLEGFTAMTFSAAEWNALNSIYQETFLVGGLASPGVKKLLGFRTFIGFRNDGLHKDSNGKDYIRFAIVLRGFERQNAGGSGQKNIAIKEVESVTVGGTTYGPVYHYIGYSSHDAENEAKIQRLDADGIKNASYEVKKPVVGSTSKEIEITSHMHLARGIGMTWLDLKNMKHHINESINRVWNSKRNGGLWDIDDKPSPIYNGGNIVDSANLGKISNGGPDYSANFIDNSSIMQNPQGNFDMPQITSSIESTLAAPTHYQHVERGEALISVVKVLGSRRSFTTSRKTGVFYCKYPNGVTNDPNRSGTDLDAEGDNTIAHEFGHMMGLEDRYCYYGREYLEAGIHRVEEDTHEYTHAAVYISNNVDTDYHNNYRWLFNLMSNPNGVPEIAPPLPAEDPTPLPFLGHIDSAGNKILDQVYKSHYTKYRLDQASNSKPQRFTFITNTQWHYITNYLKVNSNSNGPSGSVEGFFGSATLFLKSLGAVSAIDSHRFNGSFVGFKEDMLIPSSFPDDCTLIVTDDNFDVSSPQSSMDDRINSDIKFYGWILDNQLVPFSQSNERINNVVSGGTSNVKEYIRRGIIAKDAIHDIRPDIKESETDKHYDYYHNFLSAFGPRSACSQQNDSISDPTNISDRGLDLWNVSETEDLVTNIGTSVEPVNVSYYNHINRQAIIKLIGAGGEG